MPFLLLLLAMSVAESAPPADVRVVVHPESTVKRIGKGELSKIFLRRLRSWADGTRALPVDQLPGSPVRERFSRLVHGRSVVTVEVYWKRMIFSGRAVPPEELENDREVLEFVRAHPGSVGYVDVSTAPEGVRQLVLSE